MVFLDAKRGVWLVAVMAMSLPSAFACQSPVGSWSNTDRSEEDDAVFYADGTGYYAYDTSGDWGHKEYFNWRFITERRRSSTKAGVSRNYELETNVIEISYPPTSGYPQALTEYVLCTGNHMVGQIESVNVQNEIYRHRRVSFEPVVKPR